MGKQTLRIIKNTLDAHRMIETDKPIIVGVSGGPDSMMLLDALIDLLPNRIIVAHLNHQFRGKEAEADAEFVREACQKKGITAEIEEYDVLSYMKEKKLGAQDAARVVRYAFYEEMAKKWDAEAIALGHHANDQAETILMRVLRGSGLAGLAGIPYTRFQNGYKIIRPLLDISREAIESYCHNNDILYITDQSNKSFKYLRNRVRLEVLPYLKKFNDKLVTHLHQLGRIVQDENAFMERLALEFIHGQGIDLKSERITFSLEEFRKLDIALQRRVIHLILRYQKLQKEITYSHIESTLSLIHQDHPSKKIDLPGIKIHRIYDKIVITSLIEETDISYYYILSVPSVVEIPEIKIRVKTFVENAYTKPKGIWAIFDYESLRENKLVIRNRIAGDRIGLLGTKGSKKVKDLFIDKKIPKIDRDKLPIISDGAEILWIPNVQRSSHGLVTAETKKFLYILIEDM